MTTNLKLSKINKKTFRTITSIDRFIIPDDSKEFISEHFRNRFCYKFKKNDKLCVCNKQESEHKKYSREDEEWSYKNNTTLSSCNIYGYINFIGYDYTPHKDYPKFIAFDCTENCESTCKSVFQLLTEKDPWKITMPKLIISINGGLKRLKFISNQHKKNFKQGLFDIIKKDQTWIIGCSSNVGIHKLVGEAISEFRLQHEDMKNQVSLIGISSWGTVFKNNQLFKLNESNQMSLKSHQLFKYENSSETGKGEVCLCSLYDLFLFCDDGTVRQYDKEIEFRLRFENYVKEKASGYQVQILFEGGKRAITNAHNSLSEKVPLVVMKGSGRAANLISKVMELPHNNLKNNIEELIKINSELLEISDNSEENLERQTYVNCLFKMYTKFKRQIVIYDIMDTNVKFDKKILEAMIIGADKSLEKTLELCIRFNCPNIAERFVFSDPKYNNMDINLFLMFFNCVKDDKSEFVNLFIENNLDVEKLISEDILKELYKISLDSDKCRCAELLCDLISDTTCFFVKAKKFKFKDKILLNIDIVIQKLSGNILNNRYKCLAKNIKKSRDVEDQSLPDVDYDEYENESLNTYNNQDLFLWAILSGRTALSEIFWRSGKDHVGSALIASLMYKKMAELVLIRGDHNLQQQLTEASQKFENLAVSVISESYNTSKTKTSLLMIRELKNWNKLTCLQIAINGDMLEFLNHSACRSYTTKLWMGGISPFLSTWKIVLAVLFSIFMINSIFPQFSNKKTLNKEASKKKKLTLKENESKSNNRKKEMKHRMSFCTALQKFYRAPIVKFCIHLFSYMVFLCIFSYMNLVELKPLKDVKNVSDCFAEIYVYLYLITFTIEEIRQVLDEEMSSCSYKMMSYFSGIWNKFDVVSILMFSISVTLRWLIKDHHFMICRCFFSLTLSMFFLRTMQFYFASKSIGPKVIMIRNMLRDILFFLSIFVIFLFAYGTLAHALKSPNSNFDIALIKNIVYFPYFQSYGELMLDNFEVSGMCNGTDCIVKSTVVICSFGIFLLLTNILLINLLIAMFGYTFNQIQDHSEKNWCYIRIQLVQEFYRRPILPPPLNVIYYCLELLFCSCKLSSLLKQKDNLLVKTMDIHENYKMCVYEQLCNESILIEMNSQNVSNPGIYNQKMNSVAENFGNMKHSLSLIGNINEPRISFNTKKDKRIEKNNSLIGY